MERTSFEGMSCPVALALERVGEWWSILILRDATHGLTRFEQFQKSLGISPNSLSRRLAVLIDRLTGKPLDDEHTTFLPGPAADDRLRAVLKRRAQRAS